MLTASEETPWPQPDARALATLRSVRAALAATIHEDDEAAARIVEELLATEPVTAIQSLSCVADHLVWASARFEQVDGWAVLIRVIHLCRATAAEDGETAPLTDEYGPFPEFAALGHAIHALTTPTSVLWAEGLWQRWGRWALVAGLYICDQLIEDRADQQEVELPDVLQGLALQHERAWG